MDALWMLLSRHCADGCMWLAGTQHPLQHSTYSTTCGANLLQGRQTLQHEELQGKGKTGNNLPARKKAGKKLTSSLPFHDRHRAYWRSGKATADSCCHPRAGLKSEWNMEEPEAKKPCPPRVSVSSQPPQEKERASPSDCPCTQVHILNM